MRKEQNPSPSDVDTAHASAVAGITSGAGSTSRSLWRSVPLWAVVGISLLLIAAYSIDRTEKRYLVEDAEQTALRYVEFIARTVPDLERLFSQHELSVDAHLGLLHARQLGDVFRFQLFDVSGKKILVSDQLKELMPLSADNTVELGRHPAGYVDDIVVNGENAISLEDGRDKPGQPDLYSEAYVPLKGSDGNLLGIIEVYVDQSNRQQRISSAFTQVAAIVFGLLLLGGVGLAWQTLQRLKDRRRGDQKIRYLAKYDVLSGALNRTSFEDVLNAAAKAAAVSGEKFAVHCVDLDLFKEVNDTLGHAAGDHVLREVANRLRALKREGDVIARLGGDEFAFLQMQLDSPQDVEACGHRIVNALASPIEFDTHRIPCGASVGAACFGSDAIEISDLLHKADLAMYRSKTSGRGQFNFYDVALDRDIEERRLLTIDLRTALADKTMSLHYQPLFDASENTTAIGFEALMRWNHPIRGQVPPCVFIPLAEQSGQIEALGTWAIEQACRDAATWNNQTHVAVNLSAAQFKGDAQDVVAVVIEALDSTGLAANRLELEITESLLISDPERVQASLRRLSSLGVRIAMDDFGTGYSSLSYLWRFPFDKVKIDRTFVKELEEEGKVSVVIASIVSLAHSLGIRVNAEGVETESQRDALRLLGCDELQGFLLGSPKPQKYTKNWHRETAEVLSR